MVHKKKGIKNNISKSRMHASVVAKNVPGAGVLWRKKVTGKMTLKKKAAGKNVMEREMKKTSVIDKENVTPEKNMDSLKDKNTRDVSSDVTTKKADDNASEQQPARIGEGDISEYRVLDMAAIKPKKKNNTLRLVLLIVLVIVIGVAVTMTIFYSTKVVAYREVNMSVTITADGNAFDTDTDMLDFAKNHPGGKSTKMITVSTKRDVIVHLESSGAIAPFISYSENDFILYTDTSREIRIILQVPDSAGLGDYDGKLKVYFYNP